MIVKIGTPVYVYNGFDVIIDCKFLNGSIPITIKWFRNGSSYPNRGIPLHNVMCCVVV